MKVLLFTLEYPPFFGGVAKYYQNLVKYWPEPGDISVLNNNQRHLINKFGLLKWLPAIWYLYRQIKKEGIELVIVGQILPLGTVAYLVSLLIKTPYSVIIHGMDIALAQKRPRKRLIAKKILAQAKNIICSSSYTAEYTKKYFGQSDKINIVNPGAEKSLTLNDIMPSCRNKYSLEKKIILFGLGRLVKRKGQDKVIAALPAVIAKIPQLVYVVAGSGPDENYLRSLAENNRNVIFLGKISEEEKWAWLMDCDIFIMPARNIDGDYEGFGIVYLEAGLAGKPVVAGLSGGTADAVIDNVTGLLVDPENTDAIASAIIKLASDEDLRRSLGEKGMKRAQIDFNWPKQIRKLYKIIINL